MSEKTLILLPGNITLVRPREDENNLSVVTGERNPETRQRELGRSLPLESSLTDQWPIAVVSRSASPKFPTLAENYFWVVNKILTANLSRVSSEKISKIF